jgi:hypothetical protein
MTNYVTYVRKVFSCFVPFTLNITDQENIHQSFIRELRAVTFIPDNEAEYSSTISGSYAY